MASALQISRRRLITRRTPTHDSDSMDDSSNTTVNDPGHSSGNVTSFTGGNGISIDTPHGNNATSGDASGGGIICKVEGIAGKILSGIGKIIPGLGEITTPIETSILGNDCTPHTRNSTAVDRPIPTTSVGGPSNTRNTTVTSSLSSSWPSLNSSTSPTISINGTISPSESGHTTLPSIPMTPTATDSFLPSVLTTPFAPITTTPPSGLIVGFNGTRSINPVIQIAASAQTSKESSSFIPIFSDIFPSSSNIPQQSLILTSKTFSESLPSSQTVFRSSETPISTSSNTVAPITAHATSTFSSINHSPSKNPTLTMDIPGQSQAQTSNTGFFQNNKLVAGTFVGTGIILAAMLTGSVFMLLRMRRRRLRERHGERLLDEDFNEAQPEMDMRRGSSRSNERSLLSRDSTVPPIHDLEFTADPSAPMLPSRDRAPTPHTAARLSWNIPSNGSTSPVDPVDPFVQSEESTFRSNPPRERVTPTPEQIFSDPNTHAAMGWILADEVRETR